MDRTLVGHTSGKKDFLFFYIFNQFQTGNATIYLKKVDLIRLTMQQCMSSYPPAMQNYAQQNMNLLEESTICAKRKGYLPSVCYVSLYIFQK